MSNTKVLNESELKNIKGGITWEMAHCIAGAWGCYQPDFCVRTCGYNYCCNECSSSCGA